jgi:hypothetical protein
MKTLQSRLAGAWCRLMHGAPMWPIHGRYRCATCMRVYPVPWEAAAGPRPQPVHSRARVAIPFRQTPRMLTRAS